MTLEKIWPDKIKLGNKIIKRIPEVSEEVNKKLNRFETIYEISIAEKIIITREVEEDGALTFRHYNNFENEKKLFLEYYKPLPQKFLN